MFFSYETEINKVEDYHRSKFGFMNRTSFCKLSDNIFTLVPPDTMHDLSEGVLPTIIATIMKSFKVKRIEINGRINEHHWVNGPVFIENSLEPKGKAIQVRSKVKLMVGFNEYLNIFYYEKKEIGIFHQNRRTVPNMVGVRFRDFQMVRSNAYRDIGVHVIQPAH